MSMYFRTSSFRPRRMLRGALLFVGLFAVIGLAMVGAVIALGVLAIGAVVHGVLTLLRGSTPAIRRNDVRSAVIEGEYRVVVGDVRGGKPLVPNL
jgi:hypothetical protein